MFAYAALCAAIYWRRRRQRDASERRASALAGRGRGRRRHPDPLYASQTGQAEALAWQTGGWLHAAGTPAA